MSRFAEHTPGRAAGMRLVGDIPAPASDGCGTRIVTCDGSCDPFRAFAARIPAPADDEALARIYADLAATQEPLGAEFEAALAKVPPEPSDDEALLADLRAAIVATNCGPAACSPVAERYVGCQCNEAAHAALAVVRARETGGES